MNEQDYTALAELIASIGVVESPICLARQVRHGTRVSQAEARHEISAFAMEMSKFNAEHSDHLARVHGPDAVSPGDDLFRWWNPMMMFLHAETCWRHRKLRLMPDSHWPGHGHFCWSYPDTTGATSFRQDAGQSLSGEFSVWVAALVRSRAGATSSP